MDDHGEIKDYLGTIFEKIKNGGSITLTQQRKVERIIELVGLKYTSENVKIHGTPACSNNLLDNDIYVRPRFKNETIGLSLVV